VLLTQLNEQQSVFVMHEKPDIAHEPAAHVFAGPHTFEQHWPPDEHDEPNVPHGCGASNTGPPSSPPPSPLLPCLLLHATANANAGIRTSQQRERMGPF